MIFVVVTCSAGLFSQEQLQQFAAYMQSQPSFGSVPANSMVCAAATLPSTSRGVHNAMYNSDTFEQEGDWFS
ncbi:hypothetical protein M5689_023125 [Euphorbia peplus]|nr:hypothetical protein M5689_023125 [Euphorbia peplus]